MSIRLLCLGDVMLGENLNHLGRGIKSNFSNNYESLIEPDVYKELLDQVDYVFYNFEYSISKSKIDSHHYKDHVYISEPSSLKLFKKTEKKIVNIANNHFSQHGNDIAQFTKKILKENNFIVVGEDNTPVKIVNNGVNLFFWGVSLIKDPFYCNEYFYSDYDRLIKDLNLKKRNTKKENEKWVISIHWGDEYIGIPSKKQIKLGRQLIDLGFDLIIGHHPHVIQPVEYYKNGVILYSLGNFIFDQNFSKKTQQGLITKISIFENRTKIASIFKSKVKNFKIKKIIKLNFTKNIVKQKKFYNLILKKNNIKYRLLMKIEVIFNLHKINNLTKNYYKEKFMKN